jgi:rhodanese-related sulfurtransferase
MKKMVACVVGFCMCLGTHAQDGLSSAEFEKRINTHNPQLLDVRTAGEFQSGHLKNSLQADWLNKEQFLDRIRYLDKSKPLLVYCASGVRSDAAAKWLLYNGFTDVQNLQSGIVSWKKEGKPIEVTIKRKQLSNDEYQKLIGSDNKILVDFGAEWCPPCKKMEPVLQQLQNELTGKFKLVKVDGGNDMEVMKSQKVDGLPLFIIYKNGKETWRKQGVVDLSELKARLSN